MCPPQLSSWKKNCIFLYRCYEGFLVRVAILAYRYTSSQLILNEPFAIFTPIRRNRCVNTQLGGGHTAKTADFGQSFVSFRGGGEFLQKVHEIYKVDMFVDIFRTFPEFLDYCITCAKQNTVFFGFIRGVLCKSIDSGGRVRRVEKSQKHVCITIFHHNPQILGYFHTPYAVKKIPAGPSVLLWYTINN